MNNQCLVVRASNNLPLHLACFRTTYITFSSDHILNQIYSIFLLRKISCKLKERSRKKLIITNQIIIYVLIVSYYRRIILDADTCQLRPPCPPNRRKRDAFSSLNDKSANPFSFLLLVGLLLIGARSYLKIDTIVATYPFLQKKYSTCQFVIQIWTIFIA